jgi:ketosteroid isomerase-like protein
MKALVRLLAAASLLTACASSASLHPPAAAASARVDLTGERAALLAADRAHAAASAASLVAGFPASLADDAVFLYPGRPIAHGRDAAAALLASLPAPAGRTMTWRPVLAGVSADGTHGYTVGYGERRGMTESSGSPWIKYISYWKKSDGGRWQVAAWALSGGEPGAPADAPADCATPASATPASVSTADAGIAARDAVRRADSSFAALAARAGAAEAFGTWVADDGVSLGRGPALTCGREAVRRAFDAVAPGALVWAPRVADAAASGDLGFTVGVATIRSEATSHNSKYLTVWKKQPDGQWRFVADGGNAMP